MLEPHLRTPDASDVEFLHSPTLQGGEPPPARAAIWWIVAAVLTIATAVGIYIATSRRAVPPAATGRTGSLEYGVGPAAWVQRRSDRPSAARSNRSAGPQPREADLVASDGGGVAHL